jgi:hypothetical protein
VIRLRRRRGIAGTILIALIVVGLALAAAAQSGARGSAALAATTQPLVQGTDVSNLTTGTYNWPDVKAAGMSFVASSPTTARPFPTRSTHRRSPER